MLINSGDRQADASRSERVGADACLTKPVSPSELFDVLAKLLQLRAPLAAAATDAPPVEGPEQIGLRILLAEDSLYNQKLAVGLLEKKGHQVTVAGNGAEAIEQLGQGTFDLVLMDVQMPDVDGLEATRRIRAAEEIAGGHMPIIAMTAQALQGDREKCLAVGMDDYLTKPVRPQQLHATISSVLNRLRATPLEEVAGSDAALHAATASAAEASPPTSRSVVDWPKALRQVDGDPVLLQTIVAAFLKETPPYLDSIDAGIESGKGELVQRAAHTIKGGFRLFGAEEAYNLAVELEELGRNQSLTKARDVARRLRFESELILRELAGFAKKRDVAHNA
jgi:CheY-like chemotaxis protein